uniref:Uncharacterized protein n=1 Tax=Rhizophora mucronata TaxID=61149 RepID=A0A2P2QQY3_RHIMU
MGPAGLCLKAMERSNSLVVLIVRSNSRMKLEPYKVALAKVTPHLLAFPRGCNNTRTRTRDIATTITIVSQ